MLSTAFFIQKGLTTVRFVPLARTANGATSSCLWRHVSSFSASFSSSSSSQHDEPPPPPLIAPPTRSNIRKQLWEFYLSTGRGSNALFESLDLEETGSVQPQHLKEFVLDVMQDEDPAEVMPYAWNRLHENIQSQQPYDTRGFKKWLVAATKMSADLKNSRFQALLEASEPHDEDDSSIESKTYTWNEETMSQSLRRMQYAVRGEVVMQADHMAAQGKQILYTNIGNPHQVGQPPISYYRQILALCDLPAHCGVDHPQVDQLFPRDVVQRAREYRDIIGPSGTGAYTHSQGILGLRKHVAEFIEQRDGYKCKPGNIFLTNGASSGIGMVLQGLLASNNDAVMIPIPYVFFFFPRSISQRPVVSLSLSFVACTTDNIPFIRPSLRNWGDDRLDTN